MSVKINTEVIEMMLSFGKAFQREKRFLKTTSEA